MPTGVYKIFIAGVKDAIYTQLKLIRNGLNGIALFAQKMRLARFTKIYFSVDDAPPSIKSKYKPNASFWHDDI
jgi:hypothetical protein